MSNNLVGTEIWTYDLFHVILSIVPYFNYEDHFQDPYSTEVTERQKQVSEKVSRKFCIKFEEIKQSTQTTTILVAAKFKQLKFFLLFRVR